MALRKCQECGKEVSDRARACIGCGVPFKRRSSTLGNLLALTFIGVFALVAVPRLKNGAGGPKSASARDAAITRRMPAAPQQAVAEADGAPGGARYYVIEDRVAERLAPEATATSTNHIYRGQAVQVYEVKDGWARVSPFYEGRVEGTSGQVARWVQSSSLRAEPPPAPSELSIADDPRIVGLTRSAGHGLDERDILILHAAARYFLETGVAKKVVDGDKSISRAGYYFLNFGRPQNHFFRPSDIPDLESRVAALRR